MANNITLGLASWAGAGKQEEVMQDNNLNKEQQLLEVMKENKRWSECMNVYTKAMEQNVPISLATAMVGSVCQ